MIGEDSDHSVSHARPVDPAGTRDEVSDAWVLAVADSARLDRRERLHVWLTTEAMLEGATTPAASQEMFGPDDAEGRPAVAVAWFEPSVVALAETLTGTQCEAHVESAIMLGLPRWEALTSPSEVATWYVRPHPMGLALHDPTGHTFARGVAEVPATWTTAARAHGWVVAVYGVGRERRTPRDAPLASSLPDRLTLARQDGTIAAARVPLRG
ncbi:hypothetical protein ACTMS0_15600 [Micromonospora sp. H33]|uniref:hypothetical protein n=1 Tax=Micromonospora sp. H33 TaxID=3452215 RepID=UPI003F8B14FF